MDAWLDEQGLYRKNTALDGTCLFRAVAEQLFRYHAPNGHVILRNRCVQFMRKNRHLFEDKVSGPYDEYLNNLSDSKQWAGQLELEALSLIYEIDFLVFKSVDLAPVPATENGFARKIMLCFTPDNFYDAVYPKRYIQNAGLCQSIVYEILYGGVFKLSDLDYAVEKMLHDKTAKIQREKYLNSQSQSREDGCFDFYLEESEGPINVKELLDQGAILFPYKVAKALDPEIYRNIEFDNWVDSLRVPRKNSFWFGNGGPLRVGVKCSLKLDDKSYNAHVQEMSPDCGPVLVFVEELGQKMTVPFQDLEPLPRTSLKPEWTFSHKHQIINKNGNKPIIGEEIASKAKPKNKNKKPKDSGKTTPIMARKRDSSGQRSTNMNYNRKQLPTENGYVDQNGNYNDNNRHNSYNDSSKNIKNAIVINNDDNDNNCGNNAVSSSSNYVSSSNVSNSKNDSNAATHNYNNEVNNSNNVVVIAEPDSTTPNYGLTPNIPHSPTHYGGNMVFPCSWAGTPCRPPPQPHVVKTINLMVNKSVKADFSDLPLSDPETVRFFFNMGIDYFRMGCLVVPSHPPSSVEEVTPPRTPETTVRPSPKPNDETSAKHKPYKNQQKPPRFMKLENPESKNANGEKCQRNGNTEENYGNEGVPEPIPVAVPYTPPYAMPYAVPYRVAGYPGYPPEAVPLESAPLTPTYQDHPTHYVGEPVSVYTIPYTVYSPPQYYYQNQNSSY